MTDIGLVLHKLQRLREYVELVRARRPATPEELETNALLRDAMALALLVAVQEAIDIAFHIAADEGWGVPDSHAAAFDLLAAHDVIAQELAGRVTMVARVRNRIAHGYASVDQARLWTELPDGLRDLDAFAAAIASWLPDPGNA